jgi:hypothetical protein
LGLFVNWEAVSNLRKQFSAGGAQLVGLFVNWDAGSNLRKQFSAGGRSVIGTLRKRDAGSNLRKQFSAGGGNQLLGLFVNGMPVQICVSNFQPGAISYWDFS